MTKPVEGGEGRSVSMRCPLGSTLPQYRRARRRGWAQAKVDWRKMNVVGYGLVQKRLMPSPEYNTTKKRKEKAD